MRFSFLLISLFMAMTSLAQETQIIRIYKSSVDIDTRYVKVTISGGSFKFQLCDKLSSECIPLGKKESYTSSQLQNARDSLRLRGVIAGGADIVLVTAATGLGYPAGLFAGFFASRGSLLVANLGGGLGLMTGFVATVVAINNIKVLAPIQPWRLSRILESTGGFDFGSLDITVDRYILDFAADLQEFLLYAD